MENRPTVSVIMITYAHEHYIRAAVEGVLMQTCNYEVELIIANDCSPDNTDAVVQDIIKNHPNGSWIKYITHETNIGMMPNFIFALNQAKGKYIALCEGDDYWTDANKLQMQVSFLELNVGYSGCFHDTLVIHENNSKKNHLYRENSKQIFSAEDTLSPWSLFHTSSFIFKSIPIQNFEWIKNIFSGDMAIFSIVSKFGKLGKVDGLMSVYRKNEGGVTSKDYKFNEEFYVQRLILFGYLNELHNSQFKELYQKSILTILKSYRSEANRYDYNNRDKKLGTSVKKRLKNYKLRILNFLK